jgi:hypothetical protein
MRLVGNGIEGKQRQMIQRNFHVWLGSAIGAAVGAIFMGAVIGLWRPDLGRLDVVSLIVVIFGVVITALTIIAAFQVSGLWANVEERTHKIEQGLRSNQKQVAREVLIEDKQVQAEAQRANQPKLWQMVLLVGGAFVLWYFYTEHVVHLGDFEDMRKEYVASRQPKPPKSS